MKWLKICWRNVFRNTRRSLMAGGIVTLGATALLMTIGFVLATFHGLKESTIHTNIGHIQIAPQGAFSPRPSGERWLDQDTIKLLDEKLSDLPQVRFSMNRVLFDGLVSSGDKTISIQAQGVEPEKEIRMASLFLPVVDGTALPEPTDDEFSAVVGAELANSLGSKADEFITVLATLDGGFINAIDLSLSGVFRTGIPVLDSRTLMTSLKAAQTLMGQDGVSRKVVVLKSTSDTQEVATALRSTFPSLDVQTWDKLAIFYHQVVTLYTNIFSVMSIIIVLVVMLSVTNTMLMTVLERVREIGTLLAVGISKNRVRLNFVIEGALIGFMGGIFGVILSFLLAEFINELTIQMPPPPGRNTTYPLLIFSDFIVSLSVIVIMVVCGALAAFLSVNRALRMSVVQALGYD